MKIRLIIFIIFIAVSFSYGCNIMPRSVQYQREEEDVIGSVDIANPVVNEIQNVLSGLGYDTGSTDGRMGGQTRRAIKEFQESKGLKNTGYINRRTWRLIEDIRRVEDERELEKSYKIKVRSAYSREKEEFKLTTKEIQTALKNAGFDPGAIDGKTGPRTKQAVKEFQKTKGLKVDGVVGPKTLIELERYLTD